MWAQWDDKVKQLFYYNYGDLPYLLDIKICYLVWRSIQPCFVVRKFKLTRPILEPSMS
ncbi:hypothetical protein Goklo_029504 [Gossypium klotzschianum]|uniref:Uncharacterized protein n=1 Tax=Gossypium klotzschianum TaxID=34286 RepID=A0A7J8W4M9_9ROSI|nr:hypothetical protein [Gossypium klotzschianum]